MIYGRLPLSIAQYDCIIIVPAVARNRYLDRQMRSGGSQHEDLSAVSWRFTTAGGRLVARPGQSLGRAPRALA